MSITIVERRVSINDQPETVIEMVTNEKGHLYYTDAVRLSQQLDKNTKRVNILGRDGKLCNEVTFKPIVTKEGTYILRLLESFVEVSDFEYTHIEEDYTFCIKHVDDSFEGDHSGCREHVPAESIDEVMKRKYQAIKFGL